MSMILASTRAVALLAGIGYDVIFQTMVKTGSSIVRTACYLTERTDYPKKVSDRLYELDLTAKIALVNNHLHTVRSRFRKEYPVQSKDSNDSCKLLHSIEGKCNRSKEPVVSNDELFEKLDMLDVMISGDISTLDSMIGELHALDENKVGSPNNLLVEMLYLQQSLVRIDTILLYIKRKFEEHQKKWLNWFGWRKLKLDEDLKRLELETKILEDRVNLISKLSRSI